MYEELYDFNAQSMFEIISDDDQSDNSTLLIDKENGTLIVQTGDGESTSFPLISEEGDSVTQAIYVNEDSLYVGSVEFNRQPYLVEYFPINDSEFGMVMEIVDGAGIGIIDIRDVGKSRYIKYFPHVLPISITIEGNHLVITTIKRLGSDNGPLWYEING